MPHADALQADLAEERRAISDLLQSLTPEQWRVQTLCPAWDVHGMAAHLVVPTDFSTREMLTTIVKARGRTDQVSVRMAARRAELSSSELVARLRTRADSTTAPPVVGLLGPYTDALVHLQDILLPLGLPDGRPAERWRPTLDFLMSSRARFGFLTTSPPDLTYAATDLDWTHGTGPRVAAPGAALALALLGRTPRLGELAGAGAQALRDFATPGPGDEPWQTIASERRALAGLLDTLGSEQWSAPSLCEAWTVHDVMVHLNLSLDDAAGGFVSAVVAARGNLHAASEAMVARGRETPPSEITDFLRRHATSRVTPPLHGWSAPLTELMVHGADVTVALHLPDRRPPEVWALVLDFLVSRRARVGFVRGRIPSVRYVATDVAWSHGTGPLVEGPAQALGLAIMGRTARLDDLAGPASDVLRKYAAG